MKQVFTLTETEELELLKNMLEESGIPCALRNEQLSRAFPVMPFNTELWVTNDDDYPRAQALCQAWLQTPAGATGSWVCTQCAQQLRGQFDSCWKCGAQRETTAKHNEGIVDENISRLVD